MMPHSSHTLLTNLCQGHGYHTKEKILILLEYKADPNKPETDGNFPLHLVFKCLPTNKKDIEDRAFEWIYSISMALFGSKVDVNKRDSEGRTALYIFISRFELDKAALRRSRREKVKDILLSLLCSFKEWRHQDNEGKTILHHMCLIGISYRLLEDVLQYIKGDIGADVKDMVS